MIPYGRQQITEQDIAAVERVLRSDWLTQGPVIERFEQAVAAYCGARQGVAVSSATAGLHLACRALDFGPGDILWTSPNTFVASANCALYCGGEVDFVDIDPTSFNLCPDALAAKLEVAELAGRLPKIVVPVHFAGQSCDMLRIRALADRYGFHIVEDASHAIGGRLRGDPVGGCRYADITVFSFHPVKIITTGEGGMLLSNDEQIAARLRRLRSHGIDREPSQFAHEDQGGWYHEQSELGYNYRMTDIQAALGLSQLDRLDAFVAARGDLAARYRDALTDLPLRFQAQDASAGSAHHLFVVRVDGGAEVRRELYDALHAHDIRAQVHYIPVHTQPFYRRSGFAQGDFPLAEDYYAGALSLPLYPTLPHDRQDHVIQVVRETLLSNEV